MKTKPVSYAKLTKKFEIGFKIAEKVLHLPAKHKKRRKYEFFSHFFSFLGL